MMVEEVFQKYTRVIRVRIHQKFRQHSNGNRIELVSPVSFTITVTEQFLEHKNHYSSV